MNSEEEGPAGLRERVRPWGLQREVKEARCRERDRERESGEGRKEAGRKGEGEGGRRKMAKPI